MKLPANACAITLLWGLKHVLCQEESTRPKDIWDVEVWGGLPPLGDNAIEPFSWNQKPVINPGPSPGSSTAPRLRNPCTDTDFLPPAYALSGWDMTKTYLNASGELPTHYQFNVTLQETANNYSLRCSGQFLVPFPPNQDLKTACIPDDEFHDDRFQGNVWLYIRKLKTPESQDALIREGTLGLEHYWYCPPNASESAYPYVYRAIAGASKFNGSCPLRQAANTPYVCNATTTPGMTSRLTPRWLSNHTEPLVPHPLTSPPEERVELPPPRDCTDMSLTYPDWVIEEGATYVPSLPKTSINTTTLNFTITSRPTGTQHFCFWGGNNTEIIPQNMDLMVLRCRPLSGAPLDPSSSWFGVGFWSKSRELLVEQSWSCGDTRGTFSRRYRANKRHVMPLFCIEDNGRVCKANRHIVKGVLQNPVGYFTPAAIPVSPGANLSGCSASSTLPHWVVSNFRFEETRRRTATGSDPGPSRYPWGRAARTIALSLRNTANDYLQSCTITLPDTDLTNSNPVTQWLRCFPNTDIAPRHMATHIRFNTTSAELRLNQTWPCADIDPTRPLLYTAIATIKATFCGEVNSTITNACQAYNCRDYFNTPAANALQDPDPDPNDWSCMADSIGRPVIWRFTAAPTYYSEAGAFFTTRPGYDLGKPRSSFSVYLENSGLARRPGGPRGGFEVGASAERMTPYGAAWKPAFKYGLESSPNDIQVRQRPFRNMVDWSFRFDAASGYLEVEHSWYCDDKAPGKPILFNGTWAGYVDMACRWNGTTSATGCYFGSSSGELVVKPQVKWQSLSNMQGLPYDFWYPYSGHPYWAE
ncbi:hypothetical protein B0T25DRAFT_608834 [Lasiosphaeria hispida]|uniref:Ig-like domain-containing protein n=1 Tax=Lasiosphaeria hispida TaxID=260671 RepID=A0AAJ0HD82_9PEZI|nr:hypothetical protein B0T25DRAFT_608834 [Lasiosphaeria hispida]